MSTGFAKVALLLLGIVATGGTAQSQDRQQTDHSAAAPEPGQDETAMLLLAVSINGESVAGDYLIARRGGNFLVRVIDLATWRIRVPPSTGTVTIEGEQFIPLAAIDGLKVAFDEASQSLALTIAAHVFEASKIAVAPTLPQPTESAFAAFLNYNVALEYNQSARIGAFVEGGISDSWGALSNSMLLGNGTVYGQATRLDTYFVRDNPGSLTRLVIGDAVTDAREWSRQVRFGGIRLGTEFGLQPNLLTFPTPAFAGSAAVPSSVELLVNDTQRFQTNVEQGPFSINQVPLVTGAGEVTLVVRDALGVERRVKSSYYVSSRLLRRGLSAWSIEAGQERRDYGLRSFGYANPFVAGSYRRGLTDRLTVESRAELGSKVQMAGGGINMVVAPIGEFSLAAAGSHSDSGNGTLYRAAFSRNTPVWNIAFSYQRASRTYREIGVERDQERIIEQFQGGAGFTAGRWGTIGLAFSGLQYADGKKARVLSANYSIAVRERAYVSLYAIHSRFSESGRNNSVGFNLTIPFGMRSSAYVQASNEGVRAEMRSAPPISGGWGYRMTASTGQNASQQAEAQWRGDVGEVNAQFGRAGGNSGARVTGSGGLLFAEGAFYPTRQVEGGFAVVQVPDQAGVRIYQENRLVGRTNSRGTAIIPDLRPYEANRLSISPADVPIDIRMPDDVMQVVPRYRGAVRARFIVARESPGTIIVVMPDGSPIIPGTGAATTDEKAFVGNEGEVFLRSLHPGMTVDIDAIDGPCRVTVATVPDQVLPRIGPLKCMPRVGI